MSNPAERFLAAADLLDKRASEATEGPWVTGGIGDYGWSVYAQDLSKRFGIETEDSEQGKADARYIATMHPGVGKLVAASMREAACTIEGNARLVAQGRPPVTIASAFLLDLADLVLAGQPERVTP